MPPEKHDTLEIKGGPILIEKMVQKMQQEGRKSTNIYEVGELNKMLDDPREEIDAKITVLSLLDDAIDQLIRNNAKAQVKLEEILTEVVSGKFATNSRQSATLKGEIKDREHAILMIREATTIAQYLGE